DVLLSYEWQPGPLIEFGNLFYYGNLQSLLASPHTLDEWFDTSQFQTDAEQGPGAFHRTMFPRRPGLRADGTNRWDGRVTASFAFRERYRLELRADVHNVMNHSQFAAPDVDPYSPTFGQVL